MGTVQTTPASGGNGGAAGYGPSEGTAMKTWKRNLLIAYLVCTVVATVFFYILLFASGYHPAAKALLALAGLALVGGAVVALYTVVAGILHERATLHAGPGGTINIERSALESTARRALSSIEGVSLQHVSARVVERKGEPVIDLTVTAVPFGAESLMATAGRIQTASKQAVEAFTDHEVRYVAVNFVEPRRRGEVKAAQEAVDARAAADYVPPKCEGIDDAAPFRPSYVPEDAAPAGPAEPKASLWERAKARVAAARVQRDEDVVETDAVVEDAAPAGEAGSAPDDAQAAGAGEDPAVPAPCDGLDEPDGPSAPVGGADREPQARA